MLRSSKSVNLHIMANLETKIDLPEASEEVSESQSEEEFMEWMIVQREARKHISSLVVAMAKHEQSPQKQQDVRPVTEDLPFSTEEYSWDHQKVAEFVTWMEEMKVDKYTLHFVAASMEDPEQSRWKVLPRKLYDVGFLVKDSPSNS